MGAYDKWEDRGLWQLLSEKAKAVNNSSAPDIVRRSLTEAYKVLKSGSTAPSQFTLHDGDHGDRVADRMLDLLEQNGASKLGLYECAQLLLSAYLHDIGMNPPRSVVAAHRNFVMAGDAKELTQPSLNSFRLWLDSNYPGVKVDEPAANGDEIGIREEALGYYIRHQHNNWSEDWIRENLQSMSPALYPGWIDDLIVLCRSHHVGLEELRGDRFDAKLVGAPAEALNLRYLAAILRVADVIEFDPERTPEAVFRHRAVQKSSEIYWYKDHQISFKVDHSLHQLHFSAMTPTAAIHKAVLETADWVDRELVSCSALNSEGAFRRGTIPEGDREYDWPWPSQLIRNIREMPGRFKFIDGAFKPNTNKILELLGSTELYENPLAALRELVQNAADAIEEQLIWQIRAYEVGPDALEETHRTLASLHKIEIEVGHGDGRIWLRCSDTGVGMDEHILEHQFLRTGARTRADIVRLERLAQQKGIDFRRTGQFGIGVLSYFMIADHLEIQTRRSQESAGNAQIQGWQFEIDGLHDFGQLAPSSTPSRGTNVILRLRKALLPDQPAEDLVGPIANGIAEYLSASIAYAPCEISVRDSGGGKKSLVASARGWTRSEVKIIEERAEEVSILRQIDSARTKTQAEVRESQRALEIANAANAAARAALHATPFEFEGLASGAARVRIWLTHFAWPEGKSLLCWYMLNGRIHAARAENSGTRPRAIIWHSWKGFSVTVAPPPNERRNILQAEDSAQAAYEPRFVFMRLWERLKAPIVAEVDWTSGGRVALHRERLLVPEELQRKLIEDIETKVTPIIEEFLREHAGSRFAPYDSKVFLGDYNSDDVKWLPYLCTIEGPQGILLPGAELRKVSLPTITRLLTGRTVERKLELAAEDNVAQSLETSTTFDVSNLGADTNLSFIEAVSLPQVAVVDAGTVSDSLVKDWGTVWRAPSSAETLASRILSQAMLTEANSFVFHSRGRLIFDDRCVFSASFDQELWRQLTEGDVASEWSVGSWVSENVLKSTASAITHVVYLLTFGDRRAYEVFCDKQPDVARAVIEAIGGEKKPIVIDLTSRRGTSEARTVTPTRVIAIRDGIIGDEYYLWKGRSIDSRPTQKLKIHPKVARVRVVTNSDENAPNEE